MSEEQEYVKYIDPYDLYLEDDNILLDIREPNEFASCYIRNENRLTVPDGLNL